MHTNKCVRFVLFGARESSTRRACGRAREARRALTLARARAREKIRHWRWNVYSTVHDSSIVGVDGLAARRIGGEETRVAVRLDRTATRGVMGRV